jgi:uncharacterized protein YecT (DUF1311 family)
MFRPNNMIMQKRCRLPLSVLLLVAGHFSAVAQEWERNPVTGTDRAAIASCLREALDRPRACLGTIAVLCVRQGTGERREAEIECTRREAAVWRERLDLAVNALMQRLAPGPRSRLASVQRSWESYVAQKCMFVGEIQSAARGAILQTGCELRAIASRAIEVERLIRRQQPDQARPELHR